MVSLPSQVTVYDSGGTMQAQTQYGYDGVSAVNAPNITGHDNANYGGDATPRGNVTSVSRCLNPSNCAWVTTKSQYDIGGNVVNTTDANGRVTYFNYNDDGQNFYAFVTSEVDAKGHRSQAWYDYGAGKQTSSKDVNGVTTNYYYTDPQSQANDPLDRVRVIVQAAGTAQENHTWYQYQNTTTVVRLNDQNSVSDSALKTQTIYDGFGRVVENDTFENASTYIATKQGYDLLGRLAWVTNPAESSSSASPGAINYRYDVMNRPVLVINADGTTATSSYAGDRTTTTSESGHTKVTATNAFGQVTLVIEDPSGANYLTYYAYDTLGNLHSVSQGQQVRTFNYDSLGRLSSATNPESGTTSYLYDGNGNLTKKTDQRGIASNYGYDELNRITSKTYSDGTFPVTYTYDTARNGVGRLTVANSYASITSYGGYDALGRVTGSTQNTQGQTFNFSYSYNLAGSLTSETYPSGRVVNTQYDGANRPIGVSGRIPAQQTTTNYVAGVSYAPHGGVASATWGNGISRTTQYNVRLQPSSLWDVLGGSGSAHLFTEDLNWGGGANDGTLQAVNTTGGTPTQLSFREDFWYDGVNRLKQVVDSGGWTRLFSYDQYGNMSLAWNSGAPLYGTTPQSNYGAYNPFNPATNQLLSASYDVAGNQTQNGSLQLSADAEGRQNNSQDVSTHVSTYYYYDQDGKRVINQTINGPTVVYVYDALGQKVAEYSTAASSSPCRTCYLSYDHLGSLRMVTDQNGNVMGMHDYLPFGEEIPAGWAGRGSQWGAFHNVAQKFTGKERDWQSGLDYFGARYYGSVLGRFTSPDAPLADQDPSDPQSWNLYSYVRNNPLVNTDPTGQDCVFFDNGTSGDNGQGDTCPGSDIPDRIDVNGQNPSDLEYLWTISTHEIPSYDPKDVPLNPYANAVLGQVAQNTAWFPNVCSGGGFVYAGVQRGKGSKHGFGGYLGSYDSKSGGSNNFLLEGSNNSFGVAGAIGPNPTRAEGLAFLPVAGAGGALVGVSKEGLSVGGYVGTPEKFPVGVGGGAYINVSTMKSCREP